MKSMQKTLLGVALVALSGSFPAMAQYTIINDNLDAKTGAAPGYTFGDAINVSRTYVNGAGVGGSVGAVLTSDFGGTNGYGGVAFQYQDSNTHFINWSPTLSDYTLSFDALANKQGGFGITVQSWAYAGFGGAFSQSGSAADYSISAANANVFQHYSINLGTLNPGLVPTGATLQIAWQMDEYMYGGPGTGDQLVIDNVQLQMAPEPSTLALCAMGAVGGFAFLRRRKS